MKHVSSKRKALLAVLVLATVLVAATTFAEAGGSGDNPYINTLWAALPPVIAIALALITKEVYSSLFVGILIGGLLYANWNPVDAFSYVFETAMVGESLTSGGNVGVLVFLVVLGTMVALMNKAGGSAAFGRWCSTKIKGRKGAGLMTMLLGCIIFIDDYFNCLTVGSVMRPVTDKFKISRSKLAYLIDATAAPVCIIAPVSSWAAAVSGYIEGANGLELFIQCIPYNFYALLTIAMMITIILLDFDFGLMKKHEIAAREHGDLFSGEKNLSEETVEASGKGKVIDLVLPILVLIACCCVGLLYSGGMFDPESGYYGDFIGAFGDASAGTGLMLGSSVALIFTIIFYLIRRVLSFTQCMESLPEGFKAMVPAILILTLAWTLNATTGGLGLSTFVEGALEGSARGLMSLLPAVVFLIGCGLAFATGTSWGTFGMLIPIVLAVFPPENTETNTIMLICMSASMAGAVMGDHCSPISDTTIMASAGAQCNHINHVSTQIPYAVLVAVVSFVMYLIAGFVQSVIILPIAIVVMVGVLFLLRNIMQKKGATTKA